MVLPLKFMTLRDMFPATCNSLFTYRPVNVTSHPAVSNRVFRWSKCCEPHNNIFYVFFCLIAHPACTVSWLPDGNAYWLLGLELLLLNSPFLPQGLSYITTQGIFLYLLMIFQCSGRISMRLFPLEFFYLLIFNTGLKSIIDILDSTLLCHIFLLY